MWMVPVMVAAEVVSAASGICGTPLESRPTPLLQHRLLAQLPRGAELRRRAVDGGAEDTPEDEDRSQVVMEGSGQQLAVVIHELFQTAPLGLPVEVEALLGTQGPLEKFEHRAVPGADPSLQIHTVRPRRPSGAEDAPLMFAFVRHPDGLVQRLDFFGWGVAKEREECLRQAERILATLRAGDRRPLLYAGPRRLRIATDGRSIIITLPANHVVSRQQGPDFTVHQVRAVVPLRELPPSAGIYVGRHPHYLHRRSAHATPTEQGGSTLGRAMTWMRWREGTEQSGRFVEEAMLKAGPPAPRGQFIHVWHGAGTQTQLDAMRSVLETMVSHCPQ